MLKVNLYEKTIRTKDGRTFPTYFVGAVKGGKAVFMDAKPTKTLRESPEWEKVTSAWKNGTKAVGLVFDEMNERYFFTQKTDSHKNVVVGKDGKPLIKMIIMKVDSVQEAIELPKSENAKKELYKTSDFFDEDF